MRIYLKVIEDRGQFDLVSESTPQSVTDVRTPSAIRVNIDSCSVAEANILAEHFKKAIAIAPIKLFPVRQENYSADWDLP